MSRYRKVEVRTWGDSKFRELSPLPASGQGLWLYLITGPHTCSVPGLFRAGRAGMAEELGWSQEGFDKAFLEVSQQGMAQADWQARLVWLPKAIEHNKPESPNVVRGWRAEIAMLPECGLKLVALQAMGSYLRGYSSSYGEAFDEVAADVIDSLQRKAWPKPSANPLPNQKQEQEQEQNSVGGAGAPAPAPAAPAAPEPPPAPPAAPAQQLVLDGDTTLGRRAPAAKVTADSDPAFLAAWHLYPRRAGDSRADAFKAWRARLAAGAKPEQLTEGVKRYAAWCKATSTEGKFVKQGATFFGPGEHYLSDWTVQVEVPKVGPGQQQPLTVPSRAAEITKAERLASEQHLHDPVQRAASETARQQAMRLERENRQQRARAQLGQPTKEGTPA